MAYGGAGRGGKLAGLDGWLEERFRRHRGKCRGGAPGSGAHEGYVDWDRAEAIRTMVADNIPASRHHGAAKHGDALLAGLVRCRRCGRKLTARYSGLNIPRYSCHRGWMDNGEPRRIAFGGLRVDDAVEAALLEVVGPGAVEAAARAEAEATARRDEVREALARDLEAARYAVDRAFRQYDAADPANRLVAAELEARWEAVLDRQHEVEAKLSAHDGAGAARPDPTPVPFATLAQDLRAVWKAPATDARLKKRIVRTLVHEVVADIDADAANGTGEIVLVVHWSGGVHTAARAAQQHAARNGRDRLAPSHARRSLVVISPIFACRSRIVASCSPPRFDPGCENTSSRPSTACRFHALTWFGCTSWRAAIACTGSRSRSASSATRPAPRAAADAADGHGGDLPEAAHQRGQP